MPTLAGTVLVIDRSGNLVRYSGNQKSLSGAGITQVFKDDTGGLWVATINGIRHLAIDAPLSLHDLSDEIQSTLIRTVIHEGELYVGSYRGIYYLPDDARTGFVAIDVPQTQVFAIGSFGNYLFAGLENQIYAIRQGQVHTLLTIEFGQSFGALGASIRFPEYLFMTSMAGTLRAARVDFATGTTSGEVFDMAVEEFKGKALRAITQDQLGHLWITSESDGIYQVIFTGDHPSNYELVYRGQSMEYQDLGGLTEQNSKLSAYSAQTIYRIEGGGRQSRLVKETLADGELTKDSQWSALRHFGDGYFAQQDDGQSGIYRRNSHGTLELQARPFAPIVGTKSGGAPNTIDDRYIWAATGAKLYQYDASMAGDTKATYSALIRGVEIGNKTLFGGRHVNASARDGDGQNLLITHLVQVLEQPRLAYADNALRFEYAAAYYQNLEQLEYSYRLEGFDPGWSTWSHVAHKEYTNLSEGIYRFRVKARNAYGEESTEAIYAFHILPPWYRTMWAYLSYMIGAILLSTLIARAYSWRLVRARKRLAGLVKKRTAELETSLAELKRTRGLLAQASHDAGMARVAKNVLHNVGNALNSVKVSCGLIAERMAGPSTTDKMDAALNLIREHDNDYASFFSDDGKGRKIPTYLQALNERMKQSQIEVLDDTKRLRASVDQIESILGEQKELTDAADLRDEVSLESLFQTALEVSELSAELGPIRAEYVISAPPRLVLDPVSVQQILVLFLQHAKAGLTASVAENQWIQLGASYQAQELIITVQDNLPGVSADQLARCFAQRWGRAGLHEAANIATEIGAQLSAVSNGQGVVRELRLRCQAGLPESKLHAAALEDPTPARETLD